MLRHVTLDENCGLLRIEADCKQGCSQIESLLADQSRTVGGRQCMEIDDSVEGVVFRLSSNPLAKSAKIIAQVDFPCWLNAGQDSRHPGRLSLFNSFLG